MPKTSANIFRMFVLFCVVLSYTPLALPQTTTTGAVEGRVHLIGSPDKGIADATVVVTNEESGLERSVATDASGNYYLGILPPGYYTITVTAPGFESRTLNNRAIRVSKTNWVIPPIALQTATVAVTQPAGTPQSSKQDKLTMTGSGSEQLTDTTDATRGQDFDRRTLVSLPLPGVRSFDDLAFLAPGVAPPPQAIGNSIGPGVGPGVGTSGQFSVNGLRSRSNNFTIDGSDNNDDDIGVRRQGFTSLVPQPIESLQEFQIITLLPEPQFGRNSGAQVNAVSRSGGTEYHGTLYGFFTNRSLNARDVFDLTGGLSRYPITRAADGEPVLVDGVPLAPLNPVGRENPFTRMQSGFVFGGPVIKNKLVFFGSFERQDLNARRESNFAVPTVAERGLTVRDGSDRPLLTGDRGIAEGGFRGGPTSELGDAFFSLFPFPNNPLGPYGANTYTEVLPADAEGNVFSGKLDWQNLEAFGKNHNLTGRYNFTDDDTILPVTGGAIFSSLEPLVRTQDFSLSFNTVISSTLTNQVRASYGRTRLKFKEVRNTELHPQLLGSQKLPDEPFLLNTKILRNISRVGFRPRYSTLADTTEDIIGGPLGQLLVSGYSPVGVDVFSFPQSRVNNTFQYADTAIYSFGKQQLTGGFDIRRVQLDSRLDRNFRPLAVFTGGLNTIPDSESRSGIPLNKELQGRDFVSVGAPAAFTQTLALVADSTIGLRSWQNYFFFSDRIRIQRNLTVTLGATYQLNTVPTEVNRRIENTFTDPQVKEIGIDDFLDGRTQIYNRDNNNLAPYVSAAWDPFGKGETSIRAGFGIYYDQIPGAVVSQSRSVFPSFFTFNLAGIPDLNKQNPGLDFLNPASVTSNSLNTFNPGVGTAAGVIGSINQALTPKGFQGQANFARPDFVLPAADLVTPYAEHWGVTVEQQFKNGLLLSVAYVGTKGVHLLRFATPNFGPNRILDLSRAPAKIGDPILEGTASSPRGPSPLGSFTSIESDANSVYHALQLQVNKRLSRGIQFTTAYTWSHAIDEVSELFDIAGGSALPQNSLDRAAERADSTFDVRHRFAYSFIWDLPAIQDNLFLNGWQVASKGSFQTGQPYSVLYFYDVNRDGNLTDRVAPDGSQSGRAGRNLFRAPGIQTVDLTLNKTLRFSERDTLEFRTECFNLFNRSTFGVPVNQLYFGGTGTMPLTKQIFIDTRVPKRIIQFALKFSF